jgi:HupE / UreJ protein
MMQLGPKIRAIMLFTLLLSAGLAGSIQAHEVRPALLDIRATGDGWYDVTFKNPLRNGKAMDISPVYPNDFVRMGNPASRDRPALVIHTAKYRAQSGTIVGMPIEFSGLTAAQSDVLIQITLDDGTTHSAILKPQSPSYIVPEQENSWSVAKGYTVMGITHILSGYDHLAFVLALILLIRNRWMLVKAITAFTVAHSISLALATIGLLNVPSKPTEAVIALSILFLAIEVLRRDKGVGGSIAVQAPWIVAFGFGLVHGLGFAGALSSVGLPDHAIPLALFAFNIGVEIGQLMFVGVVLVIISILHLFQLNRGLFNPRLAPYAIGAVSAYWVIDRTVGFLVV